MKIPDYFIAQAILALELGYIKPGVLMPNGKGEIVSFDITKKMISDYKRRKEIEVIEWNCNGFLGYKKY